MSMMTARPCSSRSARSMRPLMTTRPRSTLNDSSSATTSLGLSRCQSRNLSTILVAWSRCFSEYQELRNSRSFQISSRRSATWTSSIPSSAPAISATAWMTLPIVLYSLGPPSCAPTAEASSQRSPHVVNASTCDGEMVICSSSVNAGPGSESAVMAYQFSGLAPRTPARAGGPGARRRRAVAVPDGTGPPPPNASRQRARIAKATVSSRPVAIVRWHRARVRSGSGTAVPRCRRRRRPSRQGVCARASPRRRRAVVLRPSSWRPWRHRPQRRRPARPQRRVR